MKAQKQLAAAPAEATAKKQILDNGILQAESSLSTKKEGARDCIREEKSPQGTLQATTNGILPLSQCPSRAKIAKRRADMPKVYRGIYDKAMTGKSLRFAVNAFCLECVCWQREEVRLCPSTPCPLWLYRPYQTKTVKPALYSKTPRQGPDSAPESSNGPDR